jgi:hypothetical protein
MLEVVGECGRGGQKPDHYRIGLIHPKSKWPTSRPAFAGLLRRATRHAEPLKRRLRTGLARHGGIKAGESSKIIRRVSSASSSMMSSVWKAPTPGEVVGLEPTPEGRPGGPSSSVRILVCHSAWKIDGAGGNLGADRHRAFEPLARAWINIPTSRYPE